MSEIPRVCATCKRFEFREATEYYSENTPGSDVYLGCEFGYWDNEADSFTESDFRSSMLAAVICDDYALVQIEPAVPRKPKWKVEQEAHTAALAALIARYPHVRIHIDSEGRGCEFRAWYDAGHGPTLSKLTRDRGEAIQWLTECLEALTRVRTT